MSSCTLQRAWRWTGSISTSTGQTQETRPSQWPHLMATADVLSSVVNSVSPEPLPLTPCEGEYPHSDFPFHQHTCCSHVSKNCQGFKKPVTQSETQGKKSKWPSSHLSPAQALATSHRQLPGLLAHSLKWHILEHCSTRDS